MKRETRHRSSSKGAKAPMSNESRLSQELHPMKNEMLLALVFESCDVETLKSCRLVCKQWKDVSLKSWRQKAVISLTNRKKMCAEDTTLTLLEINRLVKSNAKNRNLCDLPHDILKKPFENYKFNELSFRYRQNYQFCLQSFHENVRFLEIPFKVEKTPCNFVVNEIILKLPNLEQLRLKFVEDEDGYRAPFIFANINPIVPHHYSLKCLQVVGEGPCEFKWREFFRIMPNLDTLKIGNCSYAISWMRSIINSISKEKNLNTVTVMESKIKIVNLVELYIQPHSTEVPVEVIDSICDCKLPLKRLTINVGKAKSVRIKLLLENHSNTLESLTIWALNTHADGSNYPRFDTPIGMDILRELEIRSGLIWGFTLVASMHAPKLEKLILNEATASGLPSSWREFDTWQLKKDEHDLFKGARLLDSPPVIMSQLLSFECDHDWSNFTPEKIRILAKVMPNLKHLKLPLAPESFQEVCASWPKLWTLKAMILETIDDFKVVSDDMQIGDEAITGIVMPSTSRDCDSPCHPNITDLKELTDFSIGARFPFEPTSILTDRSVIHGFLKLPRLHYLEVNFKKISLVSRDSLKAHVPVCNITVNNERIL